MGVYPSALHIRWTPPDWASSELGVGTIAAVAVDDEPTVFWDGGDARARIQLWREAVGFRQGDVDGDWGKVVAAGNGTSGRSVAKRVVRHLDADAEDCWFSDVVDQFFVKSGGTKRREQADAIADDYTPFAQAVGLPVASLPARPPAHDLIELALSRHRHRLRAELEEANAPVVVTLGEEARRVLQGIADDSDGPATLPLERGRISTSPSTYGAPGRVVVGTTDAQWYALVHPGQRQEPCTGWHDAWIEQRHH